MVIRLAGFKPKRVCDNGVILDQGSLACSMGFS